MHQQDRLDLRVIVRVVAGEQLDPVAVGDSKAGGRIGDPPAGDQGDHAGEHVDAHAPGGRGAVAVAPGVEEARPRHHVHGRVRLQPRQQVLDETGVVLAVAVDLHGHLVAVLSGVQVAGLHGPADAEVERQRQHRGTGRPGAWGGRIGGAVVDDEHVEPRGPAVDLRDRGTNRTCLVVGGHYRELLGHVPVRYRRVSGFTVGHSVDVPCR